MEDAQRRSPAVLGSLIFKGNFGDFPGGPVVKNLPSSAVGLGLIPGQGGGSLTIIYSAMNIYQMLWSVFT